MFGIISLVYSPATQSFASTSDNLTITGNGDTALMELKATKENGETNKVSDFELTADNVLFIEQGDSVNIDKKGGQDFTKASTTDSSDNRKEIPITPLGRISFAGYSQGIYTLDAVLNGDKLYEGIIVIGQQNEETVKKEITEVNNRVIIDIDIDCGKDFVEKNGECVPKPKPPSICYFDPDNKACDPIGGKCPPGFGFNDDDRCIPHGKCPDGYGRADEDETGTCYKIGDLKKCPDGSVRLPSDSCPKPYTPMPTKDIGLPYCDLKHSGLAVLIDKTVMMIPDCVHVEMAQKLRIGEIVKMQANIPTRTTKKRRLETVPTPTPTPSPESTLFGSPTLHSNS